MRFLDDRDKPRKRVNTEQITAETSDDEDINVADDDDSNQCTIQASIPQPSSPQPLTPQTPIIQPLTPQTPIRQPLTPQMPIRHQPQTPQPSTSQAPASRKRKRGGNNDNSIMSECLDIMRNASTRLNQPNSNSSLISIVGNLFMGKMHTYSMQTRHWVERELFNILVKADQDAYQMMKDELVSMTKDNNGTEPELQLLFQLKKDKIEDGTIFKESMK
ncbi:uncharacterized protein LOC127278182 [Leptopilina boulardi]|uniref:uncharacterized protein LOC127278182 n=1 Tax=Leptopilina boulardi TaxID=63433 RepID=UPI0021F52F3A|nr:uncharacterized protein LOC127278182 [Leptopilina boulardi]